MSNYGLSNSGGGPTDADSNAEFESLLAQLRRQSSPSPGPGAGPGADPLGGFHYTQGNQSFYGHHSNPDSPSLSGNVHSAMDSPAFLPEAPTPPNFGHSQFPPGLMNPIGAGRGGAHGAGDERTAHLLNILKYNSGQSAPQNVHQPSREPPVTFAPAPVQAPIIHAPAPAAADPSGLLAALIKGSLQPDPPQPEPATSSWNQSPSSGTQQYLLNLLNRPKPSQNDAVDSSEQHNPPTPPPVEDDVGDIDRHGGQSAEPTLIGTVPSRSEFDFESKHLDSPPPKFDSTPHSQHSQSHPRPGQFGGYGNPFEDLSSSSPVNRTPKSSTTPGASGSVTGHSQHPSGHIQILKKPDSAHSNHDQKRPLSDRGVAGSPEHSRRKLDHTATSATSVSPLSHHKAGRPPVSVSPLSQASAGRSPAVAIKNESPLAVEKKESVAEAVNGLAEQVDREARDALARAEHEQAQAEIEQGVVHPKVERTDDDFAPPSEAPPHFIKQESDREDDKAILESTLPADADQETKDAAYETAQTTQGPVADSWESAEADEIVVIEETTTPVKVYNFPMKPWIAISLLDNDEPRPVFPEEAILDIARLKKDFDQIDRNLVAASENYMAYGMSKQGGLRVIRQEDGKDAKLFTDTKDRIFNVSISTSPATAHPREAIIGTGVSGTVYWVQLKNGDRDHLEDAHPEQYGLALPPISAQEGGDTPGGVLKTRARTSSMHPEFFAVGRGKSINIIWPSFVFENNLFKDGHDRVVDTEMLLKQCSLKINTGKAGKDFTFSQDDTLVVSLDKSGRVKFWDVRDLTAVKEGSDVLNPTPARTSLEIKEPLMTLTTTPEGEKAWPTSVLLLDKFRPYQKRAALRYMIVGMKQNHTLQLWDLALGKPVQEFNFPHNKESDAVCSVMYHAPSSMIVVGHPTRNSIYFLHLSAPKYSLKNLSQVDYIQRLVAQDSSIPQPESTAVISGIREYSFANKGVLRSLHILENPAASGEGDDPALFELYAMHSKGVTCLVIKQAELGWTKDNKVISSVDAVEVGLAKTSKLVAPPPLQAAESQHAPSETAPTPTAIRIATRGAKDAMQKTPSSQGEDKKGAESSSPPKLDRKDDIDTPVQQPEKSEKRTRKKKGAGANNAAQGGSTDRDFLGSNGPAEGRAPQGKNSGGTKSSRGAPDSSSGLTTANNAADLVPPPNSVSAEHFDAVVASMEARIVANIAGRFDTVFNDLLKQMQNFQEGRDSAFATNQSTLLQIVGDVLNDNIETVLKNLIVQQINDGVIPEVCTTIDRVVSDQLSAKATAQVGALQKEIQRLLPNAVTQALQKPDVVKTISDKICHNVNASVETQIAKCFSSVTTTLAKTTAQAVHQRVLDDVNHTIGKAFDQIEKRRRDEDAKLERLLAQTKDLADMFSTFSSAQAKMQQELDALRQQALEDTRDRAAAAAAAATAAEEQAHGRALSFGPHVQTGPAARDIMPGYAPQPQYQTSLHHLPQQHMHQQQQQPQNLHQYQQQQQLSNQEQQVVFAPQSREDRGKQDPKALMDTVDGLMRSGNYSEASLQWLHSNKNQMEEIFQRVLANYDPAFVQTLQPLLLLSVGTALSNSLKRHMPCLVQRVNLLEAVLLAFSQQVGSLDNQVSDVTPKVMLAFKTQIEQLLLDISRLSPHDPILKQLATMLHTVSRVADTVQVHHSPHGPSHLGNPF